MNAEDVKIKIDCSKRIKLNPSIEIIRDKEAVKIRIELQLDAPLTKSLNDTPHDLLQKYRDTVNVNFDNVLNPCW